MTILCIKMKTGEDVIARVSEVAILGVKSVLDEDPPRLPAGAMKLEEPRVISIQEVPGGRMAQVLLPYLFGDHEADMVIDDPKSAAVGAYKPRKEIENAYVAQTSKLDLSATLGKKIAT